MPYKNKMMKFLLYDDCKWVKGYLRSIVYDLTRTNYEFCPNYFCQEAIKSKKFTQEFISFCKSMEYGFYCPDMITDNFVKMSLNWSHPAHITNCVIEINTDFNFKQINIIEQIGCLNFQLIFNENSYSKVLSFLKNHIHYFDRTNSIDILVKYSSEISQYLQSEKEMLLSNSKIRSLILLESSQNKLIQNALGGMYFIYESISSFNEIYNFKNLSIEYFNVRIHLFLESQAHHTYFNRKLYIGPKGEIKNAPECEETFGNINEIENAEELKHIIATPEFQKYWYIHKELCDVCKDCEFRHMCVDSRLPFQREDDSWYHKTECNYNPYICKWEGEEGYRTLEECGVISDEKGFSIDHERIAAINKILWEEEETESAK